MATTISGRAADHGIDDEQALVRRAQAGDAGAFGELYDRHVATIYRYTYGKTSSRAVADDLTSETFLRAFRAVARRPRDALNFPAWLITIARNLVIDHHRSGWSRLAVVTDEIEPQIDESAGPEQAALTAITNAALRTTLDRLPDDHRECLLLRFYAGLSISETADVMQRSQGAIKQLQWRATNRLRALLGGG